MRENWRRLKKKYWREEENVPPKGWSDFGAGCPEFERCEDVSWGHGLMVGLGMLG